MSRRRQSPLAKFIPDKVDAETIKRDGWRNEGILVVAANDARLDFVERKFIEELGKRIYGERLHGNEIHH